MAIPTWGMLEKSQTDDEKIEEAIARLILEHNENEEAHLGAGQSLQSHKAAEILDHLINSIIADKIKDGEITLDKLSETKFFFFSSWESVDGWDISGTVQQTPGCVRLDTTAVENSYTWLSASPYSWSGLRWAKSFIFQSTVKLHATTNQLSYFGVGGLPPDDDLSFVGFKVSNGTLYAYLHGYQGANIVEQSSEITGITLTNFNVYRVVYDQSAGTIKYYVNGVLKVTFDSNFPDNNDDVFADFYIKTLTNAIRYMSVIDVLYSSDK